MIKMSSKGRISWDELSRSAVKMSAYCGVMSVLKVMPLICRYILIVKYIVVYG